MPKTVSRQNALLFLLLLTILYATFRMANDRSQGVMVWFAQSAAPDVLILTGNMPLCDLAQEKVKGFSDEEKKRWIPFFQQGLGWQYKDFEQRLSQPWWLAFLLIDTDVSHSSHSPAQVAMSCFDQVIAEMAPVGVLELLAKSLEGYVKGQLGNRAWSSLWRSFAEKAPQETAKTVSTLLSQDDYLRIGSILHDLLARTGTPGLEWASAEMKALSKYIEASASSQAPFSSGRLEGDFARFQSLIGYWSAWGSVAPYGDSERQEFRKFLSARSEAESLFIANHALNAQSISKEKLTDLVAVLSPMTELRDAVLAREALRILQSPSILRLGGVELMIPQLRSLIRTFLASKGKGIEGLKHLEALTRMFEGIASHSSLDATYDALKPDVELFLKVFAKEFDPSLAIGQRTLQAIARGPFSTVAVPTFLSMLAHQKWRTVALGAALSFQKGFEPILKQTISGFKSYSPEERGLALRLVSALALSRPPYRASDVLTTQDLNSIFSITVSENDGAILGSLHEFARGLGDYFLVYAKEKAKQAPVKTREIEPSSVFIFYFLLSRESKGSAQKDEALALFQDWLKKNKPVCDAAYRQTFRILRSSYPLEKIQPLFSSPEAQTCLSNIQKQIQAESEEMAD